MNLPSAQRQRAPCQFLSLLWMLVLLSGCGFRLAGTAELPASLAVLNLTTTGFSSEQHQQLANRLQQSGARLGNNAGVPTLSVRLFGLSETTLFEDGGSGQTRRLSQQMSYQIKAADNAELQKEHRLRQESDLEIDLLNIVASERERAEMRAQMLDQLISRMIYQLQRM